MCCSLWSSDDITSPFLSDIRHAHTGLHGLQLCLIATVSIHMNLRRGITREQEGLRVSTAPKPLVPLHVHFPETLKETRVYLRIHNSDIARLVKYLFLTAESF